MVSAAVFDVAMRCVHGWVIPVYTNAPPAWGVLEESKIFLTILKWVSSLSFL